MVFSEQISDSIVHVGFFVFEGVTRWDARMIALRFAQQVEQFEGARDTSPAY